MNLYAEHFQEIIFLLITVIKWHPYLQSTNVEPKFPNNNFAYEE